MKLRVASLGLAAAAALSAGIAPTAQAQSAGEFSCNATLNLAIGSGHTNCTGFATGILNGAGPATAAIDASVDYVETGCPVVGTATGTVSLDAAYFADITYVRVGVAAVAVLTGGHTGAAVGVFTVAAGDVGPGLCSDTNVDITLTGAVAAV